jgi:hypothetical protein
MAAAFASTDMADAATFRRCKDGTEVACTVYVDKGLQQPDFGSQRGDPFVSIISQRSEIGLPVSGDTFTVEGVTFRVDLVETLDDSLTMSTVVKV